ncbi:regulatory protein TetR [Pseudodesulfovibrio mercurii]|uniref:Regulatory protein TetR n=1 Tax=Pseudodesulfovibrio mercurii TaxID=641491 RepID=F0JIJ4_9BACT|nr:TetR/AcrR family transcriptional regulator [Pseudodesulfovibrio mercurii]EGB15428.1 regulatory protein TetR [Pseudodesulfovibrio mercurii]
MRKRLDSDVRRGQIAEAALKLVVSEGISALTVKNIARQVGVTPPALYRHYAGKTEILAAVVEHISGVYAESRRRVFREAAGPVARLRGLFFSQVRLFERHPAVPVFFYSDLLWREEPSLGERFKRHLEEFADEVSAVIRRGQDEGGIRADEPPERLFVAFLGLFSTLGILAGRGLCHVDMAAQAETNWKIFETYITAADAPSGRAGRERNNCEVVP